jgi:nucleotide-binding universal stress UspA family protein
MDRIVVGFDGTQKDRSLTLWIGAFAREVGAHLIAAHFIPMPTAWLVAGAQVDTAQYIEELQYHFENTVLDALREVDPCLYFHIDFGDPAHELASLAVRTQADLIAIGAQEHSRLHDAVFGSVERQLVRRTSIPVLAVPCVSASVHALGRPA